MKFVALISGGKDSCFNILHCIKNGHELIALANLYPPEEHGSDELDSFMYQTVGYQAVELYGEALDVPLYRAPIKGKSVAQGLDYTPTANDESEDLYQLLATVKESHPDVEAVSVGAILSTYQRTRVESVCSRLGLVSLAFLWQRSQAELLDEIINSGMDARIIKTAGIGLNRSHLGKSLREMRGELVKLNSMYGLHLCGEGGEYETLVFDAPIFKKKLVIQEKTVIDHSNDDVSYLSLRVKLESKVGTEESSVTVPPLLEERFQEVYDQLNQAPKNSSEARTTGLGRAQPPEAILHNENMLFVGNIRAEEVGDAFDRLKEILNKKGLLIDDDVVFLSLIVKDMGEFQKINDVYRKYFSRPNPPARFCVEGNVEEGRVQLSVVAIGGAVKNGLHVQGQSYWAPANIGPYSQGISVNGLTYLAGQIGLIPSNMKLIENDVIGELVLSLQNLTRVEECMNSEPAYYVAFVANYDAVGSYELVSKALELYESGSNQRGLLAVGVNNLPRNASYEWTSLGIEKNYHIQYVNDNDQEDKEDELFIWPQKHRETDLYSATQFGYKTTIVIGTDKIEEIEEIISSAKYGKLLTISIYGKDCPQSMAFPCEFIASNWVVYRGKEVLIGAVLMFTIDSN